MFFFDLIIKIRLRFIKKIMILNIDFILYDDEISIFISFYHSNLYLDNKINNIFLENLIFV